MLPLCPCSTVSISVAQCVGPLKHIIIILTPDRLKKKKYYCIAQDVRYNRITTQNIYSYTSQKLQSNPL